MLTFVCYVERNNYMDAGDLYIVARAACDYPDIPGNVGRQQPYAPDAGPGAQNAGADE